MHSIVAFAMTVARTEVDRWQVTEFSDIPISKSCGWKQIRAHSHVFRNTQRDLPENIILTVKERGNQAIQSVTIK